MNGLNRFPVFIFRSILASLAGLVVLSPITAARSETVAISIPLSGDFAELGRNFRSGAKLAIQQLGLEHELFIADDGCDPDLAHIAAKDIKALQPDLVLGMICNDPAIAIASELAGTGIPVLVAGARSIRLIKDREREQWNVWRMSVGDDYPVEIAADAIESNWKTTPYAIVDDGTIYGRSFTDLLRQEMRDRGHEPQFSDTFRSAQSTQAGLLRRLQRSGVTAAFIASATLEDLFTIASDSRRFGIPIDFMMTEPMQVLPFLEEAGLVSAGIKVVAPAYRPNPVLEKLLAEQNIQSDIHVYMGFAAIQVAQQLLARKNSGGTPDFTAVPFRTVLGSIGFKADGSADFNPYRLMEWNGTSLREITGN